MLEPGGRIAGNVANLGRKPYRSLAADVMAILQDDLHLLPRGEIVWQKGEGASGSCAWGSFRSPANPVLRDVTQRVVVASKGRFGRARSPKDRKRDGLPHESSIGADDFMALTLDVWDIPPESALRVRHPAPFPVELPQRLMELDRIEAISEWTRSAGRARRWWQLPAAGVTRSATTSTLPTSSCPWPGWAPRVASPAPGTPLQGPAVTARRRPRGPGRPSRPPASPTWPNRRLRGLGMALDFTASDGHGRTWYFDVAGANSAYRGGSTVPRRSGVPSGGPT